jgi:penicillin G amidase
MTRRHAQKSTWPRILVLALALVPLGCATTPHAARGARAVAGAAPEARRTTLRLAGTVRPALIRIDTHGVPYISARTEADLAFAMGYMHARDRRFQMELIRMDSLGRLRELLGEQVPAAVLRLEIFSRMLGFSREASNVAAGLSARDLSFLEAYARGVNLATAREPRPVEFRLLRYVPQPWTPLDSIAILETVSFGFCKDWEQELARLELIVNQLQTGSTLARALAIWPARLDLPPHLVGEKPAVDPFASIPAVAPELAQWLQEAYSAHAPVAPLNASWDDGGTDGPLARALTLSFLSNNWAVDGRWTRTGRAAFAVDPHMPSSLPPLPYIMSISLDSPEEGSFAVVGAGFPGLPAIPFGTNGKVAWGPTSNWADSTDLFVERPVEGRPGFYQTEKGPLPFEVRRETFRIRQGKGYRQETRTARATRHGVIVNDFIERLPANFPLVALERAQTFGDSLASLRGLYAAGAVREAREALQGFTAMVGNWVIADSQGAIGYTGPLNLPLRRHSLGTVPVPGWTGTYEWEGMVPRDRLPWIENPPQGYLATANNEVVDPDSTGYPINFEGDVPHRVTRILEVLSRGRTDARLADQMSRLQTDGRDNSWSAVRPLILEALVPLADEGDMLGAAARTLLSWNGQVDPSSPAPTLYQSLLTVLMDTLLGDEVTPATLDYLHFYFNTDPLLFGILGDPENPAWENRRTRRDEPAAEVVAHAFGETVGRLARAYGPDVQKWTWRRAAPVTLAHPLGSVPGFWSLNRTGIPPRGTASSLFMHRYGRSDPTRFPVIYGPALRLVVDFADMDRSFISIPGGESGKPGARHYDDILPLFEKGEGVALGPDPSAFRGGTELVIELGPTTRK